MPQTGPPTHMRNPASRPPTPVLCAAAAVAGWVLPGLGHVLLGERQRGLLLGTCVGMLLGLGLLIGGLGVVDHARIGWWAWAQRGAGPAVLVLDHLHTTYAKGLKKGNLSLPGPSERAVLEPDYTVPALASGEPQEVRMIRADERGPLVSFSWGRAHDIGLLYLAAAGVLNIVALLDICRAGSQTTAQAPNTSPSTEQTQAAGGHA